MDDRTLSRRLAYVLRHAPESVNLRLEDGGWVDVTDLLGALSSHGVALSREQLDRIVSTSDKQRFAFDPSGGRIRANRGHSISVDLHLTLRQPPAVLYHGTVAAALDSIRGQGLLPQGRHHVHLSVDVRTARSVGRRRGPPVVLEVDSARAWRVTA